MTVSTLLSKRYTLRWPVWILVYDWILLVFLPIGWLAVMTAEQPVSDNRFSNSVPYHTWFNSLLPQ